MKMQRGHLLPVVAISLMAAALPALAETVTVNTVTTALPGETVGQMVARVTPLLQDMALKQQRGTLPASPPTTVTAWIDSCRWCKAELSTASWSR